MNFNEVLSIFIVNKRKLFQNYNQKLHLDNSPPHPLLHYNNMPIQIYWKFYHQKNENFPIKNSDIFFFLLKT